MKIWTATAAMLAVVLIEGQCLAQERSYAEEEFINSCAACHGREGRGNGPLAEALSMRPADLTSLGARNGGVFPYDRVVAIIDGRYAVPGHGDRDMPVWGQQFLEQDAKMYGREGGEMLTAERIRALTGYVEQLQR